MPQHPGKRKDRNEGKKGTFGRILEGIRERMPVPELLGGGLAREAGEDLQRRDEVIERFVDEAQNGGNRRRR